MYIESLELLNFRNYPSLSLSFDRGTNLFYGDNAQGKTNILEAVYLAGTTKSHRGSKDRDIVRIGENESHIRMMLNRNGNRRRIDMHLKKNKPKGIAIDGIPIRKAADLFGIVSLVFFSPEDLSIIKNGPGERRRFIDLELSALDRIYLTDLARYNKCLNQRNRLLHDISFNGKLISELDVWDEQAAEYGSRLIRKRIEFTDDLNEIIQKIHRDLTGGKEEIRLVYEPSASEEELAAKIRASRDSDLRIQTTTVGPHRDDLGVLLNGLDTRLYGSQGQQRTAALSLKLSEISLVKEKTHDTPVLLLDDVLSELDSERQKFLLAGIRDTQTLITCTGMDELTRNHFQVDKSFHVKSGSIED